LLPVIYGEIALMLVLTITIIPCPSGLTKLLFFFAAVFFERTSKETILLIMLQFSQVKKQYNGRQILFIQALDLAKGIYWLQGPNGSGKTTLLRMVAGLIPFEGEILFDGLSLRHQPLAYRRKISWAEAEPVYPPFLTGIELIRFYRQVRKASALQINRLTSLFGLEPWLKTTTGSYSSGMMKRLSLLLAFIGEPELILLDEPLATLDEESALVLSSLIGEYHKDHGTGFMFSSHHSFYSAAMDMQKKLLITDQTILLPA
jgi:ABC-2 type transport system ATP-binding protein